MRERDKMKHQDELSEKRSVRKVKYWGQVVNKCGEGGDIVLIEYNE